MDHWYALNSKPHQECRVGEHLRQRRLEVYVPLVRVNPVNPRAARIRPYFPGYLFVHCDFSIVGVSTAQWTPGLRGVVSFGGPPGIVPDAFICELRQRQGADLGCANVNGKNQAHGVAPRQRCSLATQRAKRSMGMPQGLWGPHLSGGLTSVPRLMFSNPRRRRARCNVVNDQVRVPSCSRSGLRRNSVTIRARCLGV